MTKKEFEKIEKTDGFDAAVVELAGECNLELWCYEAVIDDIKEAINENDIDYAIWQLQNIKQYECFYEYGYWQYNEKNEATPIKSIKDVEEFLEED